MIDFFTKFPSIPYTVDGFTKSVANIVIGEIIVHRKIDSSYVLWKKDLLDGDSPVSVSDEIYKTTQYYWTLFYINNIVNPYTDWFMSQSELEAYTKKKYPDIYGLHHFIRVISDSKSEIIDDVEFEVEKAKWLAHIPQGLNIIPVTNIDYEKNKNDLKRSITVISPRFIDEFVNEFHSLMSEKYDNQ